MIYLDYAANTPVDKEVADTFYQMCMNYIGNPNSPHSLGVGAAERMLESTTKIAGLLGVKEQEIIYTSGASESNNMAIKGIAGSYKRYGKHIITTFLEHASVTGPFTALQNDGFEVDFVNIEKNGQVDLHHLKELIREDTILVSVGLVDSEIGTIQPITEINQIIKERDHLFLHVDATQAVGKIPVNFQEADLITFSAHKFYGVNGSGILIKKEHVMLEPLIHGGLSTTSFRSGTPALALAASTEKALSLAIENQAKRLTYVRGLNQLLREKLSVSKPIVINSPKEASPYILNISVKGVNTNKLQAELDQKEIYIATKSACCAPNTVSKPVYAMTKDRKLALATVRISLSHLTTKTELEEFISVFLEQLQVLNN
ncbi:aminotransferase V [Anaerocolumna cellulosilytica]|uniref:Aminotransferase V n=1 Tax=Anaerocolumna cellulosilytica TaxID=433286 RepID=A0A6S6R3A8_9FIRM|nr:cysteine desulfurase family protein [Anaerocolumna cellulosilytica]MBB5194240.1 cysteine desulfurase [Anaerocolumna cellulosilytica]BCJ94547.1 aminotransferase V [Anaerocolumna cellulosilytica]